MKFVHPEILWALGALSVPIIVHLFNFRKFKRVFFSNVSFLKEIQVETQSRSRLKHLLILLARLLAMACIILAFAQPFIPLSDKEVKAGERAVSVYIDNSFSTEGESGGAPILEIAKNKAIEVVQSYSPSDKFQLLTNDFEGRHQRLVSREEMVQLIQEVRISPIARKTSEVFTRQRDVLNGSGFENKVAFHLSDLQKSVVDLDATPVDTSISLRFIPTVAGESGNVYIDSAWFATPVRQIHQTEELIVRLVNTGDEARENLPLKLTVNGQQKGMTTATIEPGSSAEVSISFNHSAPGLQHAQLTIEDYPIVFDDTYYLGFSVLPQISVLRVKGSDGDRDPVAAVFTDDSFFAFTSATSGAIDFSAFPGQQLIVFDQLDQFPSGLIAETEKYVTNGGSVCIIPSADADFSSYNELLSRLGLGSVTARTGGDNAVSLVDYSHLLFAQTLDKSDDKVEMPRVNIWYSLALPSRTTTSAVMMLRTGTPLLTASQPGSGRAYFFSVSTDTGFSSLTGHAFFPALLLRMAELGQRTVPLSYPVGGDQAIELRNMTLAGEETFRIRATSGQLEFIPEHRNAGGNTEIFIHAELSQAGNYELTRNQEALEALAFNYDRKESVTEAYSGDELSSIAEEKGWGNFQVMSGELESIGKLAAELQEGKKYWWTMMVWAMIFLAAEILLIKYWR